MSDLGAVVATAVEILLAIWFAEAVVILLAIWLAEAESDKR